MTSNDDDFWNNLFHGCAVAAYVEQAAAEGQWPPDAEATRQRAYRYYEEALAAKNAAKAPPSPAKITADRPTALDSESGDCKNVSYETETPQREPRSFKEQ
jgi:hypothetical protein